LNYVARKKKKTLITVVQPNQIEMGFVYLSDSALGAPAIYFLGALFTSSNHPMLLQSAFNCDSRTYKHLRLDTFWREKCLNGNFRSIHLQEGAFEKTYEADCEIETLKKRKHFGKDC
jgi:hypothetical protein